MYSEQLEQLIKSVIADGVITEKERAVLHKKAASEGVDEDEIDVYIDGLVAQMKPTVKQEQKFDLKYLNKSKKDTYTVYEGKNLYRVNGFAVGRIQELYLNFFKKIEKDDEQLGISVITVYKEEMKDSTYSHPRLFINTQTCELDLEDGKEWVNVPAKVMSSKRKAKVFCFELDRDMLKAVCESEKIFMSLIGLEVLNTDGYDCETIDFNKIAIHDFATFAQVFYRSVIDSSSYQNAELDSDLLAAISKGNEGLLSNDRTLTLLMTPQKKLKKVDVEHKYFNQFILPEPGLQLVEFDEKHSIGGWSDYIRIYSIKGKGKTEFFLKVSFDYRIDDERRKEPIKKKVDFNDGYFRIVCDANTDIKIAPLMTEHPLYEVKNTDTEINFYRISAENIRKMIEAEDLSFSIYGGKETIEDIRHLGFKSSSPFVWKQAFATLMGEEVPEKKTLFGRIKGMFT